MINAIKVKITPRIIPLYWNAQGMVTIPVPAIAFQQLKIVINELYFFVPSPEIKT